jgi:hypothetical protein
MAVYRRVKELSFDLLPFTRFNRVAGYFARKLQSGAEEV